MATKVKHAKLKKKILPKNLSKPSVVIPNRIKTLPKVPITQIISSKSFKDKLNDIINDIDVDTSDLPEELLDSYDDLEEEIKPKLLSKNWLLWSTIFVPFILPSYMKGMSGTVELPPDAKQSILVPAPTPKQAVDYAKQYFTDHGLALVKTLTQTDCERLKQQMLDNWGKGPDKFAAAFKEDYINSTARLETIYRTERVKAENEGIIARAKNAKHTKVIWNCALDERSCDICSTLQGQITDIGEVFEGTNVTSPPIHPSCRCVLTSLSEDEFDSMPDEEIYQDASYLSDVAEVMKLNYNCPDSEKVGEGPGSCSNSLDNNTISSILTDKSRKLKELKSSDKDISIKMKSLMDKYGDDYATKEDFIPLQKAKRESLTKVAIVEADIKYYKNKLNRLPSKEFKSLMDDSDKILKNISAEVNKDLNFYLIGDFYKEQAILSHFKGNIPSTDDLAKVLMDDKILNSSIFYSDKTRKTLSTYNESQMRDFFKSEANKIIKRISNIDSVVNQNTLKEDITVYSGISSNIYDKIIEKGIIDIPTLISTSRSEKVAQKFADFKLTKDAEFHEVDKAKYPAPEIPTVLEMHVKKGSNALSLEDYSDDAFKYKKIVFSDNGSQQEVLIGHGTRWKVIDHKEVEIKGKKARKIIVEQISAQKFNSYVSETISYLSDVADVMKLNYKCPEHGGSYLSDQDNSYLEDAASFIKLNYRCDENPPGSGNFKCDVTKSSDKDLDKRNKLRLKEVKTALKDIKAKNQAIRDQMDKVPRESPSWKDLQKQIDTDTLYKLEEHAKILSYKHPDVPTDFEPFLVSSDNAIKSATPEEQKQLDLYVAGWGNALYQGILARFKGKLPESTEEYVKTIVGERYSFDKDNKFDPNDSFQVKEYNNTLEALNTQFNNIKNMDSIIGRSKLQNDLVVQTGTSSSLFEINNLNPGDEFEIPTYISTSRSDKVANGFALRKFTEDKKNYKNYNQENVQVPTMPTVLEIHMKAGSKALALENFALTSQGTDAEFVIGDKGVAGGGSQQEVLLARGSKFKVKEITTVEFRGKQIRKLIVDGYN